ncbi:hypothetical protein ACJX0J_016297, partial [Zea mays]
GQGFILSRDASTLLAVDFFFRPSNCFCFSLEEQPLGFQSNLHQESVTPQLLSHVNHLGQKLKLGANHPRRLNLHESPNMKWLRKLPKPLNQKGDH